MSVFAVNAYTGQVNSYSDAEAAKVALADATDGWEILNEVQYEELKLSQARVERELIEKARLVAEHTADPGTAGN